MKKGSFFGFVFFQNEMAINLFVSLHLEAPKLHGFILFSANLSSLACTIFISTADVTS